MSKMDGKTGKISRPTPRWKDGPDIDCDTCWKRGECERFSSGSFCGQWQSKEPDDRGESPADRWSRGDEDSDL